LNLPLVEVGSEVHDDERDGSTEVDDLRANEESQKEVSDGKEGGMLSSNVEAHLMRKEDENSSSESRIAHVGEELSPPSLVLVESYKIRRLVQRSDLSRLVEEHREGEDGVKDVVHIVHRARVSPCLKKEKEREESRGR